VTINDLARTIDGGVDASDAQKSASLLGACGSGGGMQGVTYWGKDPAYNTPAYIASKAKPLDMIIKLVHAPSTWLHRYSLGKSWVCKVVFHSSRKQQALTVTVPMYVESK
jgi:hypothetical protein